MPEMLRGLNVVALTRRKVCWRSRGSAEIWTGTADGGGESAAPASSSALRRRLARGSALLGRSAPVALPLNRDDVGVVNVGTEGQALRAGPGAE